MKTLQPSKVSRKEIGHQKSFEKFYDIMMTSSNGTIFRVTGPFYGEFTGDRRIPLTKASDA